MSTLSDTIILYRTCVTKNTATGYASDCVHHAIGSAAINAKTFVLREALYVAAALRIILSQKELAYTRSISNLIIDTVFVRHVVHR